MEHLPIPSGLETGPKVAAKGTGQKNWSQNLNSNTLSWVNRGWARG